MKKYLLIALGLIFLIQILYSQGLNNFDKLPFIEVTGYAEMKIIPDEIYISITIKERESGRNKISVSKQEQDLKQTVLNLNIPLENFTVFDANADYIRVKWNKKNVISQREYELKLSTAKQVSEVFEKLDELKIHSAYVSRVNHSKIDEYKKNVEINAIKAAKEKADYLLEAIGQKTGTALIINERGATFNDHYIDGIQVRGSKSLPNVQYVVGQNEKFSGSISFKKIKLETTIYAKFEIKK